MWTGIRGLYSSRHQRSRDVLGTLAPFTVFILFALVIYPDLRGDAVSMIAEYLPMAPIGFPILGMALYSLIGYCVGSCVNALAVLVTSIAERLPWGIGPRFSYVQMYTKIENDVIDRFYNRYFGEYKLSVPKDALGAADKLDSLKDYLKAHNPDGFANIHRQFARVDMTRAFFIYGLLIVFFEIGFGEARFFVVTMAMIAMAVSAFATPRRLRKVVRAQSSFLIAAAKLRDDSSPADRVQQPPALGTAVSDGRNTAK